MNRRLGWARYVLGAAGVAALIVVVACRHVNERSRGAPTGTRHRRTATLPRGPGCLDTYWWAPSATALLVQVRRLPREEVWQVPLGTDPPKLVFEYPAVLGETVFTHGFPLWGGGGLEGVARVETRITGVGQGSSQTTFFWATAAGPAPVIRSMVVPLTDGTLVAFDADRSGQNRRLRHLSARGQELDAPTSLLDPWVVGRLEAGPGGEVATTMILHSEEATLCDLFLVVWGHRPRQITRGASVHPRRWTWLPDGKRIRFVAVGLGRSPDVGYTGMSEVEVATGNVTTLAEGERLRALGVRDGAWLPDGRAFVWFDCSDNQSLLRTLGVPDGDLRSLEVSEGGMFPSPSPDGRWLAYETGDGAAIRILDLRSGEERWSVEWRDGLVRKTRALEREGGVS